MIKKSGTLESKISKIKIIPTSKIMLVDTAGNITSSLIAGSILDYCVGLNLAGIIASRTSATAMNLVTGGPYGWLREQTFRLMKTNEDSGVVKKTLTDLIAFNTFQVPVYATAVAIGSLISEEKVDWNKVISGASYLAIVSPLIGPTLGLYMDGFRKLFGVKSAVEGAYKDK